MRRRAGRPTCGARLVLGLAAGLSAFGCAGTRPSPPPVAPAQATDPTSTPLTPGDAVRLKFWLEPALSGDFVVDEAGVAVLPLLGSRDVTAESAAELKRTLQGDYAKEITNQEVAIALVRRVRVLGAVKEPGLYFMDPTMSLGDVLALAGGITTTGKQNDIKVFRGGREIGADLQLGDLASEHLTSGDEIFVPESSWFSRNGAVIIASTVTAAAIVAVALFR